MDEELSYITGLIEGEGCFATTVHYRRREKSSPRLMNTFRLSLAEKDQKILERLQRFMGCGKIIGLKHFDDDHAYMFQYYTQSKKECRIIEEKLKDAPWTSTKGEDYKIWCEINHLLLQPDVATAENKLKILGLMKETQKNKGGSGRSRNIDCHIEKIRGLVETGKWLPGERRYNPRRGAAPRIKRYPRPGRPRKNAVEAPWVEGRDGHQETMEIDRGPPV